VTEWTTPKPFLGEGEYGRFAFIEVLDESKPVNFIVHRGDAKDPAGSPDRSFDPAAHPEIWLREGDETIYRSQAQAQGYASVHYECTDCTGVTISATSDGSPVAAFPPALDDYGIEFRLAPPDPSLPLTVTISVNGVEDIVGRSFVPTDLASAWFQAGEHVVYRSRGAAEDYAVIHYRRPAGDYGNPNGISSSEFWGLHVWDGAAVEPTWTAPLRPVGLDVFGLRFEIPLDDGAPELAYALHRGDTKDPGPDQRLVFDSYGNEAWQLQAADPDRPYVAPRRR
jgi:hypothetical protein